MRMPTLRLLYLELDRLAFWLIAVDLCGMCPFARGLYRGSADRFKAA